MLHITKLAVGIRDIAHLRQVQAERDSREPPLRHRTRNFPRRASEIIEGGSIYWIIGGTMLVRQRVLDVIEDKWEDDTRCAGLVLDPALVPVEGRATRAFQGWRYLADADAPADVSAQGPARGADGLSDELRRQLRALCLI